MRTPITFLSVIVLTCTSQGQPLSIESTDASCEAVCNGSVDLSSLELEGDIEYSYRQIDETTYFPLKSEKITGLCAGRYEIKEKRPETRELRTSDFEREPENGYVHLREFQVDSRGLRDSELRFSLPSTHGNPAYFLKVYCSTDQGEYWRAVTSIYQLPSDDHERLEYTLRLPISADNNEEVLVDIHQLDPDNAPVKPLLELHDLRMQGMQVEHHIIDIGVDRHMEIHSVVSNEDAGNDGYIHLNVSKGKYPYRYVWAHGPTTSDTRDLCAGIYEVEVIDDNGCSESARFSILPSLYDHRPSHFDLLPVSDNTFLMTVERLYRQRLSLELMNSAGEVIKTYHINPLYEDLKMNLDLSHLGAGEYRAKMTGTRFEMEIGFQID